MDLWIRSQDKESLTKISNIQYTHEKGNLYTDVNEKHYIGTYYDNLKILGTYKTKERALEVLDEIQELIKPKQIITTYKSEIKECINKTTFDVVMTPEIDNIQLIEPTTLVYEMPID